MKVISRREHESLVIDNEILVTVLEVAHGIVRLAISSPTEGYREETLVWNGTEEDTRVRELLTAVH